LIGSSRHFPIHHHNRATHIRLARSVYGDLGRGRKHGEPRVGMAYVTPAPARLPSPPAPLFPLALNRIQPLDEFPPLRIRGCFVRHVAEWFRTGIGPIGFRRFVWLLAHSCDGITWFAVSRRLNRRDLFTGKRIRLSPAHQPCEQHANQ
jgi:hypothetical protein